MLYMKGPQDTCAPPKKKYTYNNPATSCEEAFY